MEHSPEYNFDQYFTLLYSIYMERIIKFVTSLYISWNYCSKKLNKSNAWYYFYFFYITTQVHFLKSSAGYWIPLVAQWTIVMSVTHLLTEHLPFSVYASLQISYLTLIKLMLPYLTLEVLTSLFYTEFELSFPIWHFRRLSHTNSNL